MGIQCSGGFADMSGRQRDKGGTIDPHITYPPLIPQRDSKMGLLVEDY